MKLKGANSSQVQSLGRENVNITESAGKVAQNQGIQQGVQSVLNAASSESAQLNDMRTKRESQQADLFMQKSDNEFWTQWGGKEFFDVDELPDEVVTEGMRTKGRISSAEVLPTMYENFVNEQLPIASKIIEQDYTRSSWYDAAKGTALGRQTKIQAEANSRIEGQIFDDQKINYTNAIESRRPDIALQIANDMEGSPTEVAEFKRKARETSETIVYENQIIQKDVPEMKKSLEHLRQQPEDYVGSNGQLDDTMRLAWISKLETSLYNEQKAGQSRNKASEELLKREISITTSNSKAGKEIDMEVYADLVKRANLQNVKNDGTLTAEIENLKRAAEFSHQVNFMNKGPQEDREAYIKAYSQSSDLTPYERDERTRQLEVANAAQTKLENNDMLKSAVESGAVPSLVPVNVDTGGPALIASQLKARKVQHDELEARYGVSQGYLTKDEVVKLSSQFATKSPKEQINFLKATSSELGKDSINLYSQMQVEGAGSLAIAGNVALNGTEAQATTILKGNEFRRSSGEKVGDLREMINLKLQEDIGTAFWNNSQYNNNVKDAVLDAYIGYTLSSGGSVNDLTSLDTGFLLSDGNYQRALEAVTGGMLEFNGTPLPAPEYGMGQEVFDDWTENMDPSVIDSFGGVGGNSTSKEFLSRLNDGEYTLEEYGEQGSYVVRDTDGQYIANKEGTVLIMTYGENFERNPETVKKIVTERGSR